MNLLLDTHTLLWWLGFPQKLSKITKEVMEDTGNTVFISSESIWEIIIKKQMSKLQTPDNPKEKVEENDFTSLSITIDHIFTQEKLSQIHTDPFDRIRIAQCSLKD